MLVLATWSISALCVSVLGYCLLVASGNVAADSVVEIRSSGKIWHGALRYGYRDQPYVLDHRGKRVDLRRDGSTAIEGARWEVLRGPDPFPALAA